VAYKQVGNHPAPDYQQHCFHLELRPLWNRRHESWIPKLLAVVFLDRDVIQGLVLEWIPGQTLDVALRGQAVSPPHRLQLARHIAVVIDDFHDNGQVPEVTPEGGTLVPLMLRDLKPQNIMVLPDLSRLFFIDFGLARDLNDPTVYPHQGAGTPQYMAPEQVAQSPLTPKVDVYAFGILLPELFTGEPWNVQTSQKLNETFVFPSTRLRQRGYSEGFISGLQEIVRRCLVVDPIRRASMIEIVDLLQEIQLTSIIQ